MGLGGQGDRVKAAILTRWNTLADAGLARGAGNNYFSRGASNLDAEVALWLERETGYRAGWLMFGELPKRVDATSAIVEEALQEGRRMAIEEAIGLLRAVAGLTTPIVETTSPGAATVSQQEQIDRETAAELIAVAGDAKRKGHKKGA